MLRWMKVVLVLVALALAVVLIAPSYDLPDTALRALLYLLTLLSTLRLAGRQSAAKARLLPLVFPPSPLLSQTPPGARPDIALRC